MAEYRDIPLQQLVGLAETSSSELGATGGNYVVDYKTGKSFEAPDYDTALFLASAREIVLELAQRVNVLTSEKNAVLMALDKAGIWTGADLDTLDRVQFALSRLDAYRVELQRESIYE